MKSDQVAASWILRPDAIDTAITLPPAARAGKFVRSTRSRRASSILALSTAALVLANAVCPSAQANPFYWTGDHDALWNTTGGATGTNWSSSPDFNNGTAGLPGSADDVFFNLFGAGNLTTQLGRDFTINSLTFTTDDTVGATIGGANILTIGAGGLTNNSLVTNTISSQVTLGAAQTWTNNTAATLLVSGAIGSTANLTLAGGGAFNFSAANGFVGTTTLSGNGTTLTLSGAAGALTGTTSISLDGGTVLKLDNTASNNANRIGDSVGITSRGGTIALLGGAATETVGTLTLSTGTTRVNLDAGAKLTFSNSIARSAGGTVNFSTTGTTNIAAQTNAFNGIIGGYATIGNVGLAQQDAAGASNVLDFAAVDASHNVIALATYAVNDFTAATNNTKVNGTSTLAASTTINSLYLTGAANVILGTVGSNTVALTIGSGGIISNGATQTFGGAGPQIDLTNAADIGSGVVSASGAGGGAITGTITSGTTSGELVVTTASNLRIDATITNNGSTVVSLTKNGSGTLDLSDGNQNTATNTYSGITTINGGILIIRADRNLGAIPTVNTANSITFNGGELRITATFPLDSHRGITVGPQGGTISYNGGNTTHLTGFQVTGSGSVQYSDIPSFGITGGTNKCAIDIGFVATNYLGSTTFFTQGSTQTDPINAVIYFSGNDKVPDGSPVTVTNNDGKGLLNLFGKSDTWGSLAGNGNIVNGVATVSNLTVGGNNLSTTYSGSLGKTGVNFSVGAATLAGADIVTGGTTSAITLTKVGTGTMTLSGASQYTGATSINGGALLVTGSLANTPVSVGNGALTGSLGGTGSIAGPVTVTSTGHLSPAITPTGTSTLTLLNNPTINSGGTFDYNFGAKGSPLGTPGISDLVMAGPGSTGNFAASGALTLNVTSVDAANFGIGVYKLIDWTGSTGTFSNTATFTVNPVGGLFKYVVVNAGGALDPQVGGGTVPANDIYLEVLAGSPALFWTGAINGTWDVNTTANWTGAATKFTNGSSTTFDDADLSGAAVTNITVAAGGVLPDSMTFNNATNNFTFGGAAITAATGIIKNQAGTVTFNNTVTTPSTTISGGTIAIGATGVFNSTSLKVNASGTLTVAGSLGSGTNLVVNGIATFTNANQTLASLSDTSNATSGVLTIPTSTLTLTGTSAFDGKITGTGGLAITGGTTTLSNGTNNYAGNTTVSGNGTQLSVTNATGSATGAGSVTLGSGATLGGNGIVTGPVIVNAGATLNGTGSFGGVVTLNGTLAPAGANAVGAIGLGATTASATTVLNYDLGAIGPGTTSDTANVTGTAVFNGAEVLNVNGLAGFGLGTYVLVAASTAVTNNATYTINALGTAPTINVYTVTVQGGNKLVLTVAAPNLNWTGATDNNWDIATTANWSNVGQTPPNTYADIYNVVFADGAANTNINVAVNVAPAGMTFTNTVATPYTIGGAVIGGSGGITKSGNGIVTFTGANAFTGPTVVTGGTISISADTNIGAAPTALDAAHLVLNGGTLQTTATLAIAANRGIQVGTAGGTLDVPTGVITTVPAVIGNFGAQAGVLNKISAGELDLTVVNAFTGAFNINGGSVKITNSGALSTGGTTTVGPTAALALGSDVLATSPIALAGGTIGSSGATRNINSDVTAASATTSTVSLFDPIALTGRNDLIVLGTLHGSGTINVASAATDTQPDIGGGFRLRGTVNSDFTGTLAVLSTGKAELQSSVAGTQFSPLGTGKIVMTGGTIDTTNVGSFSLINLRNQSTGNNLFGNDLAITGTGFALINILGTAAAGTVTTLGNLTIGAGQTIAAVETTGNAHTLAFTSVKLTGGAASFAPRIPGNTTYTVTHTISLGPVSETAPSSLVANGVGTVILTAPGTYTGGTTVQSGTLSVAADNFMGAASGPVSIGAGTLATTSGITSARQINLTDPAAAVLVSAAATTTFTGKVTSTGTLNATGPGTLILNGSVANDYQGGTNISGGGTLLANNTGGTNSTGTGAVTVMTGSTLGGNGTLGGPVTVATGGTITAGVTTSTIGALTSTAGTSAFNDGGKYLWKLGNPTAADTTVTGKGTSSNGLTGAGIGWDLLKFSTLNVASPITPFTIALSGNVNFGGRDTYVFPIVSTTTLTGFDPALFKLDTTALTINGVTGGAAFGIQADPSAPNQIDLTYTAVPEPVTFSVIAAGVLALAGRPRRRRQSSERIEIRPGSSARMA